MTVMDTTDITHLQRCLQLAQRARAGGDQPFGSLVVSGDRVVAESLNSVVTAKDCTGHPELDLARWAYRNLAPPARETATMYTSCEHCAMCSGAFFWSGLGRLVFALSGEQLRSLQHEAGAHPPTMELSSREVLARGNRPITVDGPCDELYDEATAVHAGYWEALARPA